MNAVSDLQLLRDYAALRSEPAFSELVRRHMALVYSAALRMVNSPDLAQDVSQRVFVALAGNAAKLVDHPVLAGWLHRTTRNIAAEIVRSDVRRRDREQQAAAMNEAPEPEASWLEVAPHLDAALNDLSERDRDVVILRYFQNRPVQEMAGILGISTEAAQKRLSRAVDRLRGHFARRGITAATAGLTGIISSHAVEAAPAGLAASVATHALAATVSSVTTAVTRSAISAIMASGRFQFAAAVTLVAGVGLYCAVGFRPADARTAAGHPPTAAPRAISARAQDGSDRMGERGRAKPVDRKKELASLKVRWLETASSNDSANIQKQIALSKESAALLLCTEETLDLLQFLKDHEFYNTVDLDVKDLFKSSRAAEARALLIELPETARIMIERSYQGQPFRDEWSNAAGQTCPEEEFEAFRTALNCKSCGKEALYGRNRTLMATDPDAAFQSTLEAFTSKVPSVSGRYGLMELFRIDLPPDLDFGKFERQLPIALDEEFHGREGDPHSDRPFAEIQRTLMRKWAERDPGAAVNHIMEHPDRLEPRLIAMIISAYSGRNPGQVVQWISGFPAGPYFDHAVMGAVNDVKSDATAELRALVPRISDPTLRETAQQRLKQPTARSAGH